MAGPGRPARGAPPTLPVGMPRVVVTVFAPDRRLELAVRDEVPVERLLPEIAEVFAADPDARWVLTPRGGEPLRPDRSLTESGVLHGAVLMLVAPAPSPFPLAGEGMQGGKPTR